jgi:hypothetical protein
MKSPPRIDNANVLFCAASETPFTKIGDEDVHGLAIAKYDHSEVTYLFYCNLKWETISDSDFESVLEAKASHVNNFDVSKVRWFAIQAS